MRAVGVSALPSEGLSGPSVADAGVGRPKKLDERVVDRDGVAAGRVDSAPLPHGRVSQKDVVASRGDVAAGVVVAGGEGDVAGVEVEMKPAMNPGDHPMFRRAAELFGRSAFEQDDAANVGDVER